MSIDIEMRHTTVSNFELVRPCIIEVHTKTALNYIAQSSLLSRASNSKSPRGLTKPLAESSEMNNVAALVGSILTNEMLQHRPLLFLSGLAILVMFLAIRVHYQRALEAVLEPIEEDVLLDCYVLAEESDIGSQKWLVFHFHKYLHSTQEVLPHL